MNAKLILPKGTTGFFNERNEWVCTGSQMGRRNRLPDDTSEPCKLHIQRLKLVDGGCYDQGGAYWGAPENLYLAFTAHMVYSPTLNRFEAIPNLQVYLRASSRHEAKQKVRATLPNAIFYH